MTTTYYLLVSIDGDTLSVDGTTILAYQAGSVEGPGGSFTLTPVFDTALISLPSEVEVWYSTDNVTFSRTAGIAGATWANNVLSGTVGSSTTIYAKLYYSTGTPVTDENGAGLPLAAVSATVGGAPAPTIGTATITGSTAPTAGAAEAYSVAFDGDATDVTYAWTTTDGGATIATPTASSTNITFAATGSVTVTCTLTSVQAGETVVDTHVVTVAAAHGTLIMSHATNGGTGSGGIERIYSTTPALTGGVSVQIRDTTKDGILSGGGLGPFIVFNNSTNGGAFISSFGLVNNVTTARVTVVETGDLGTNIYTADGTFNVWSNGTTNPDAQAQYRLSGVTYSGQFASELGYDGNTVSVEVYFKVL